MSTCIGCNRRMFDTELAQTKQDGTPEDLCNICRGAVYDKGNYEVDHEYVCGNVEEGLTMPSSNYY